MGDQIIEEQIQYDPNEYEQSLIEEQDQKDVPDVEE